MNIDPLVLAGYMAFRGLSALRQMKQSAAARAKGYARAELQRQIKLIEEVLVRIIDKSKSKVNTCRLLEELVEGDASVAGART